MTTAHFTEATDMLTTAASDLNNLLHVVHPGADCLPLPPLGAPADQAEWAKRIIELAKNLFTDRGHHRAQRWIDARETCTHLDAEQVIDINELLYRWYQLLIAAREHVDVAQPTRRLYDLTAAKVRFDASLAAIGKSTPAAEPPILTDDRKIHTRR